MNFRKLITYLTMGTAAAMPLAVAQNPTILQGNYISNVFGNSNFVLNPNALTNTANVTVSNATVTRSTTTPLVATSEFLVTTSTATGSATWSTRTFDAGMKGQNCEARFTYRGFSVGSTTAQILQGANVVAQLTLTPSTDPRIASINFPCGDLSAATTFRLQQATASLTGTNEIGGIYVGLATNMANVAQAEFVGSINFGTDCDFQRTANTYATPTDAACSASAIGNVALVSGVKPGVTINDTRPGTYRIVFNTSFYNAATNNSCYTRVTDGTTTKALQWNYKAATATVLHPASFETVYQYTASGTKTIEFQILSSDNTSICSFQAGGVSNHDISVYRFPSSSELVVTPERQNVFGFTSGTNFDYTTKSGTFVTPSGFTMDAATGQCQNDGTNIACKIATLPAGRYSVQVSAPMIAQGGGSGNQVCSWGISDGIGLDVAMGQTTAQNNATVAYDAISSISRQFSYSSVRTNVIFKLIVRELGSGGAGANCLVATNGNNRYWQMSVTPLDQPSNSALYVQGPVLGAQTGAAIPSGYQMEGINSVTSSLTSQSNGVYRTGTGLNLNPGVYFVTGYVETTGVAPTGTICGLTKTVNGAPIDDDTNMPTRIELSDANNTLRGFRCKVTGYFRVTSATPFYITNFVNAPTSSSFTFNYAINAIRLN